MAARLEDYPLKAFTDSRSAMAERLRDFIAGLEYTLPKTSKGFKFRAVYEEWSSFESRAMSAGGNAPAAAVLPDRSVPEPASFAPRMIENTWSGGDPNELNQDGSKLYPIGDGTGDGFALFEVGQRMVPFVLVFRALTKAQRKAINRTLETAFVEDGATIPDPTSLHPATIPPDALDQPVRYGRRLKVDRYFGRFARFTITAGPTLLDTDASATENRWMAQFEIEGHMQICAVRRVRAMRPRVELIADDLAVSR